MRDFQWPKEEAVAALHSTGDAVSPEASAKRARVDEPEGHTPFAKVAKTEASTVEQHSPRRSPRGSERHGSTPTRGRCFAVILGHLLDYRQY